MAARDVQRRKQPLLKRIANDHLVGDGQRVDAMGTFGRAGGRSAESSSPHRERPASNAAVGVTAGEAPHRDPRCAGASPQRFKTRGVPSGAPQGRRLAGSQEAACANRSKAQAHGCLNAWMGERAEQTRPAVATQGRRNMSIQSQRGRHERQWRREPCSQTPRHTGGGQPRKRTMSERGVAAYAGSEDAGTHLGLHGVKQPRHQNRAGRTWRNLNF